MKIIEFSNRSRELIDSLLTVWESAVRKTHSFLSDDEIKNIKAYVPQALTDIPVLICAVDCDRLIAFMGVDGNKLEMLFVTPEKQGQGVGKALLQYGFDNFKINEITVNEQNPQAIGFYKHMGFYTYKRTDTDEQGNPYPILYMKV